MFKKLKYKFDTALERDFSNLVLFLLIFSLVGIVIFAVIFGILQLLGLTSKDVSFLEFIWKSFTFFLDVGALSEEPFAENNFAEITLKILITIFGIIIFSTLIGIITSTLSLRIEELRSGKSPIDEGNHIIICNFTKKTIPLIQELISVSENKKLVITLVTTLQPVEAQARISTQIKKNPKIKIICRKGYMWQPEMINIMNVAECQQVIILNPDVDNDNYKFELDSDIEVTKELSAIVQSSAWKKNSCNIIAEYFNPLTGQQALEFNNNIIGDKINRIKLISSSEVSEQLIAQCVNTPELIQIFESLFGFEGSELYLIDEKNFNNFEVIYNKTIQELNRYFDNIIILGCYFDDNKKTKPNIILNPNKNFKVQKDYGIICLARDEDQIKSDFKNLTNQSNLDVKEIDLKISEEQNEKNILIINTADEPEKVIDINNSILNLNYQKNIKNIKILNKIGNLDKDKLINKYEFQFSNVIYGVEFQIIEFMFKSKPHYAYQVTNKFDYPTNHFKDLFEIGDYLLYFDWISEKLEKTTLSELIRTNRGLIGGVDYGSLRLLAFFIGNGTDFNVGMQVAKSIDSELFPKILKVEQCKELGKYFSIEKDSNPKLVNHTISLLDEKSLEKDFKTFFNKENINEFSNVIVINNEIEGTSKLNPVEDHDMINYYLSISNNYKNSPKLLTNKEKKKWTGDNKDFPEEAGFKYKYYKDHLLEANKNLKFSKNNQEEAKLDEKIEENLIINLNSVFDNFNDTKYSKENINNLFSLDTDLSHSYITEVNSFRTKNILENFKKNISQTFYGTDIIDLNSIIGKVMASTIYQPSTVEIVKKLLNENHFIRSYTIQSKNLQATFRELEAHFQKQNQILLGYIDYDYANFIDGGERKIRKIGINPNQREVIKLNIGDRLITLSHY